MLKARTLVNKRNRPAGIAKKEPLLTMRDFVEVGVSNYQRKSSLKNENQ